MAWGDDLAELAATRGPALVGYAYLLTGDLDRAQDLVQEALARAFGRPRLGADLRWTEAYVRRTILNAFLDGARRDRLWTRSRHLFAVDEPRAGQGDQVASRTADHVDVQAALALLPPRERACVVLRFYDDLTVPALAERLGISEGAAKRYLSDGVRRLESVLGPAAADAGPAAEVVDVRTSGRSRR
ncbi:MAG: sigma-70 family RNA polymerase sigma factor [Actinomycetales bacterium]|jgi:RNA polymerase sigma-70 factor (ECF subfamily)|nr:sigma-70 family RNA polymerase sigma factor [Actinomycetales bacterium]